jgi:hypothetical protein
MFEIFDNCPRCRGLGVLPHHRLGDKKDRVNWHCPTCVALMGFVIERDHTCGTWRLEVKPQFVERQT